MHAETRTRRIDDGEPLLIWRRPNDPDAVGYGIFAFVCRNPDCNCDQMELGIRRARRIDDNKLDLRGDLTTAFFSVATGAITVSDDPSKDPPRWVIDEIEGEHTGWPHERWRRVRGQAGDLKYRRPPTVDPGFMTPYCDIDPCGFDLTLVHERRSILVDDYYCMNPGCDCDQVQVVFSILDGKAEDIGEVRAPVSRLSQATISGRPVTHELWKKLVDARREDL